ncbi:MAG TPA: META domain-containing protein [Phnomibacter sp.]|nr:META domain-containing protein [Phnomibacter sp.]
MTKMLTAMVAIAFTTIGLAQRANEHSDARTPVPDGKWIISSIMVNGTLTDISARAWQIEFKAAEGQVHASICNIIRGGYSAEENEIKFGQMISTKMYCQDMLYETAFLMAIGEIDSFYYEKNRLILKKGDEIIMIFSMPVN